MCKHAVPNWTCYTSLLVYVTLNIGYHNGFKNKKYKSHINHGNIALHCSLWGFFHLWIWQADKIIRPALEAFLFFPLSWSINILRSSIFCCASTTWYHHCDKTVYTSMLQFSTHWVNTEHQYWVLLHDLLVSLYIPLSFALRSSSDSCTCSCAWLALRQRFISCSSVSSWLSFTTRLFNWVHLKVEMQKCCMLSGSIQKQAL